jgi:hypothetical protein
MAIPEDLLERMWMAGDDAAEVGVAIANELICRARARRRIGGVLLSAAAGAGADLVQLVRGLPAAAPGEGDT